jgi:FkbM family methyltransferase
MNMPNQPSTDIFNVLVNTRQGPMLVNRNDRYVGQSLIAYGEFSEGEAQMFRQLAGSGDVVVEAGSNIGAHTLLLSRLVGAGGVIYAFEPQRIVFQTLCGNLALNQCVNVVARQQGLGSGAGQMVLPGVDPRQVNNFGGLSLLAQGPGEKVDIASIDSLGLQACRLIKADVEGMEADVLLGAKETLARCRPLLYLENDRAEKSPALIGLILDLGYRLWWHVTPLYNPDNFLKNPSNQFGGTVSINLLCQPAEAARPVDAMREIKSPADTWNAAPHIS